MFRARRGFLKAALPFAMGHLLTSRAAPLVSEAIASPVIGKPYVPVFLRNAGTTPMYAGEVLAVSASEASAAIAGLDSYPSRHRVVVVSPVIWPGEVGEFAASGIVMVKTANDIEQDEYVVVATDATRRVGKTGVQKGLGLVFPRALGYAVDVSANGYVPVDWWGEPLMAGTAAYDGEFYEDFEGVDLQASTTEQVERWKYSWLRQSAGDVNADGGRARVSGDGANAGTLRLRRPGTAGLALPFNTATMNMIVECRWAQFGTGAATRRIGLAAAVLSADGTGIYFRHTNAGVITAVARTGASESPLSTGIVAANGFINTGMLVYTGDVEVFINGGWVGTITGANIPTVPLGPTAGGGSAAANGLDVDAIRVRWNRVPFA